jgi:hypothetical protein
MAGFGSATGGDPAGEMAGFDHGSPEWLTIVATSEPGHPRAEFCSLIDGDPAGEMAGFGSSAARANRR